MERPIEAIVRELDGPTPPMETIDEYHDTVRDKVIRDLAMNVALSVLDETGKTTDKLIDIVNKDDRVPAALKADVFQCTLGILNDALLYLAKQLPQEKRGDLDVRGKDIP